MSDYESEGFVAALKMDEVMANHPYDGAECEVNNLTNGEKWYAGWVLNDPMFFLHEHVEALEEDEFFERLTAKGRREIIPLMEEFARKRGLHFPEDGPDNERFYDAARNVKADFLVQAYPESDGWGMNILGYYEQTGRVLIYY
jgi:hypothetical protein